MSRENGPTKQALANALLAFSNAPPGNRCAGPRPGEGRCRRVMRGTDQRVSATRPAEFAAAMQFPSLALGPAGSYVTPPNLIMAGRALELPRWDNQNDRCTISPYASPADLSEPRLVCPS
jgi:hypothetical protein